MPRTPSADPKTCEHTKGKWIEHTPVLRVLYCDGCGGAMEQRKPITPGERDLFAHRHHCFEVSPKNPNVHCMYFVGSDHPASATHAAFDAVANTLYFWRDTEGPTSADLSDKPRFQ